ncbi:thioredoxin [Flavivirga aquatica]|uniref:Thioredoxin n=1 Tax=Flavivirga aquatica TaxID=1849968 RepID=A0A1E5T7R1_9FLAO|nr:thioredoxin family protein [Flavivirga aquatica]OEK07378.1 thioredoxin [Flavivirga aquatica]
MKKILFILLFTVFTSINGIAQGLTWHTNMDEAFDIAAKEEKPLMLFFTGSDWCGWCIKLQNEVFKTADFKKWAKDNVVLVELDYPKRTPQAQELKTQNYELQRMFNVRGYPTVFFANPQNMAEGKKNLNSLGSTGFVRGGAEKWLAVANNIIKK